MAKYFIQTIKKALMLCGIFLSTSMITIADSTQHTALDNVLTKQCWFSGTFTQEKSLIGLPTPLMSNGKFLFDCERGLIWHTENPIVETKIYTTLLSHFTLNDKREIEALDGIIQTATAKLLLDIMSANTAVIANNFIVDDSNPDNVSLTPNSPFLKKGIQSIRLKKDSLQNALTITLIDKKSQNTRIHSVKTYQSESKQDAFTHCQTLFTDDVTCDVLNKPINYEINSD